MLLIHLEDLYRPKDFFLNRWFQFSLYCVLLKRRMCTSGVFTSPSPFVWKSYDLKRFSLYQMIYSLCHHHWFFIMSSFCILSEWRTHLSSPKFLIIFSLMDEACLSDHCVSSYFLKGNWSRYYNLPSSTSSHFFHVTPHGGNRANKKEFLTEWQQSRLRKNSPSFTSDMSWLVTVSA